MVDTSSVVGEVSGLVIISVVTSSVVTVLDVGVCAIIVRMVTLSVSVVLSVITVVSLEVAWDVVMFLGMVSWIDVVEAVGLAVLGGGCGEREVGAVGVDVVGGEVDSVRTVGVLEGDGKIVEAGVVGEGEDEVRETDIASEDAVEGATVVVTVATTVDAEDVDVLSLVIVSGSVD